MTGIKVMGTRDCNFICKVGNDVMEQIKEQYLYEFRFANEAILDRELICENIHSDDNFIDWMEKEFDFQLLSIKNRIIKIAVNDFVNLADFLEYM